MTEIRLVTEATAKKNGYKIQPNFFYTNKADAAKMARSLERATYSTVVICRAIKNNTAGYRLYRKNLKRNELRKSLNSNWRSMGKTYSHTKNSNWKK